MQMFQWQCTCRTYRCKEDRLWSNITDKVPINAIQLATQVRLTDGEKQSKVFITESNEPVNVTRVVLLGTLLLSKLLYLGMLNQYILPNVP